MTRKATDISMVRHYSEASATILTQMSVSDSGLKLRKAEIYAKLALAAAVEKLVKVSLELGEVKVDLDLIADPKAVQP